MPHLLVAGTTGSGKSVAINAMILSLIYKATPSEVRLIMVDPKMLELSVYEGIPHLLAPVVTDMRQASSALNWCAAEMERRYKLLSAISLRNLAGYNQKVREGIEKKEPLKHPFSLTPDRPENLEALPLIVVPDELCRPMMVQGKKVEELIARPQRPTRRRHPPDPATQRPSVDVPGSSRRTPTRIAFQAPRSIRARSSTSRAPRFASRAMLYPTPGGGIPRGARRLRLRCRSAPCGRGGRSRAKPRHDGPDDPSSTPEGEPLARAVSESPTPRPGGADRVAEQAEVRFAGAVAPHRLQPRRAPDEDTKRGSSRPWLQRNPEIIQPPGEAPSPPRGLAALVAGLMPAARRLPRLQCFHEDRHGALRAAGARPTGKVVDRSRARSPSRAPRQVSPTKAPQGCCG
jgi:hypothetical protein